MTFASLRHKKEEEDEDEEETEEEATRAKAFSLAFIRICLISSADILKNDHFKTQISFCHNVINRRKASFTLDRPKIVEDFHICFGVMEAST